MYRRCVAVINANVEKGVFVVVIAWYSVAGFTTTYAIIAIITDIVMCTRYNIT